MSSTTVGLLAALGPNAFGAAIGALIGGRLGDLFGRKRIYQYDLLVYAFGILLIVFSLNLPMLLIGTFIVGVAVGADVPTSLALIGEFSPSKARGKLMGLSQVAWSLGPIVVYVLAFALTSYGVLGSRIVFAHLFVVAIVTWALRRGMVESAIWTAASGAGEAEPTSDPEAQPEEAGVPADPLAASRLRNLFLGPTLAAMVFTATVYLFWNLAAGTFGVFSPYILKTLGTQSQAASVALSCAGFVVTLVVVVLIFMPFSDRSDRSSPHHVGRGGLIERCLCRSAAHLPLQHGDRHRVGRPLRHWSRDRGRTVLQDVVAGAVPHHAQNHGAGAHVRRRPSAPGHLELLRARARELEHQAGRPDTHDLPPHQRRGRLRVHAEHRRQVAGGDRGRA